MFHSADALNVDNDHFLYSQYSKEKGRYTDRNTCSWSVTQHLVKKKVEGQIKTQDTTLSEAFKIKTF